MKKLIIFLFIFSFNFCFSQWEMTNWRNSPEIREIYTNGKIIILRTSSYKLIFSADSGNNWQELNKELFNYQDILSVDFIDDNIFINTFSNGVYLSTDLGNSWEKRNFELLGSSVSILSNNNRLYAIAHRNIFVSDDLGDNWELLSNNLENSNYKLRGIFINGQKFVAFTNEGILISTNSGKDWNLKNNGLPYDEYTFDKICFVDDNIFISSIDADIPIGGESNVLYSSSDNGDTWVKRNSNVFSKYYSYTMLSTTNSVIIEAWDNLFYSDDTCKTWQQINKDIQLDCYVTSITSYKDNIYVALGGDLFLVNKDWNQRKLLYTGQKCGKIDAMVSDGKNIFIAAYYGWMCESVGKLYSSSDKGDTWDTIVSPYLMGTSLANSGNVIVAGTQYRGCYISTDAGKTFQHYDTPDSVFEKGIISSVAIIENNIIVSTNTSHGTKGRIYLSSDYGNTWIEKSPALNGINVLSLAVKEENLFAATEYGIYLSTDMGNNWTLKSKGLPDSLMVYKIGINGDNLFAGTVDGVYFSTDMGENWQVRNSGLPAKSYIKDIIFSGNYTFICNYEKGVYMSSDNGLNWLPKNEGLASLRVGTFAILDDYLFLGTNSNIPGTLSNDAIYKAKIDELITGVSDYQTNNLFFVYPNPAKDFISVNFINSEDLEFREKLNIEIYDMLGLLVQTQKYVPNKNDETRIDISNLLPGVYFLKINGRIEKFVKM